MKCQKQRTVFNLFEVYSCKGCTNLKEEQHFCIGEQECKIIYVDSGCILEKNQHSLFYHLRMERIWMEIVTHQNKGIFIVENEENIIDQFEILEMLFSFEENIYIVAT